MTATVDLRPGKLDIKMSRGDTAAFPIEIREGNEPADLSDRQFSAQIRRSPNAAAVTVIDVDMNEAAGGILILRLDAAVTDELSGEYRWDLQQSIDGQPRTLIAGKWTFVPDVTREPA